MKCPLLTVALDSATHLISRLIAEWLSTSTKNAQLDNCKFCCSCGRNKENLDQMRNKIMVLLSPAQLRSQRCGPLEIQEHTQKPCSRGTKFPVSPSVTSNRRVCCAQISLGFFYSVNYFLGKINSTIEALAVRFKSKTFICKSMSMENLQWFCIRPSRR